MVNVTEKAPPAYVPRKDPKGTAFTVAVKMHFGSLATISAGRYCHGTWIPDING